MDSHVFRLLALELAAFLCGGRVEKTHSPAPGLLCLTVFNHGLKRVLVLRHSKIYNHGLGRLSSLRGGAAGDFGPAIYLTERKLPNPQKPSTLVMTLRKQVQGHRLGAAVHDWVNRRVFFALPQPGAVGAAPHWLCLDLISGPSLHYELPEITTPVWPEPDLLPTVLREAESWRTYPVLTPLLRKSLSALAAVDPLEAAALLGDLHLEAEQGTGGLYIYGLKDPAFVPQLLSVWPLPPQVRGTMVLLDEKQATGACDGDFASAEFVYPGLEAARRLYEPEVLRLPGLGWDVREQRAATESAAEAQRGQKRLERTLLKLDQEESRLRGLADLRRQAIVLQGELWRYAPDERLDRIVLNSMNSSGVLENPGELEGSRALENPGALAGGRAMESSDEQGEGLDGQPCEIRLDPLKSVRENMAALFKQSERGARGLAILADRRRKLTAELAALQEGRQPLALADGGQGKSPAGGKAVWEKNEVQTGHEQVGSGRTQGGKTGVDQTVRRSGRQAGPVAPAGATEKLVQRFVSSDGFVILRGRSALGNQAMLKLARPHEIWLHVQGGPSAHVLIRRDNLGVTVPDRTLREAAILSAVKSWRKNESKAEVILALARDVKPVKGGPPGSVLVDKLLGSLMVTVDFELEAVLLAGANGESAVMN